MTTALYAIALATYAAARAAGSLHSDAAAAAWSAVRSAPEGNRLRCHYWDEGGWHSTAASWCSTSLFRLICNKTFDRDHKCSD